MKLFRTITLILFSGLIMSSWGAELKTGETVDFSGAVKEDFYAAAGSVTFNGDVAGDATLFGGDVTFNGKVTGDMLSAGGKVSADITGSDDIRIIGGQVDLTANTSGDVFVGGGDVLIDAKSNIAGDLYIAGGTVTLDGFVKGNVVVYSGNFNFTGKVGKNLTLRSDTSSLKGTIKGTSSISSEHLKVHPEASFSGNVEYWSEGKVNFNNAQAVFNEDLKYDQDRWEHGWAWGIFCGFGFLGFSLLTIFFIVLFMKDLLSESGEKLLSATASSLGYGVMYYLLVPVLIIFLTMSVIGTVHGLFIGTLYAFSIVFSGPLSAVVLFDAFMKKYQKVYSRVKIIFASFGVYFLMLIVMGIPGIGMLINMLVVGAATGSVVMSVTTRIKNRKS